MQLWSRTEILIKDCENIVVLKLLPAFSMQSEKRYSQR